MKEYRFPRVSDADLMRLRSRKGRAERAHSGLVMRRRIGAHENDPAALAAPPGKGEGPMALILCLLACQEWTQDAHDAQRTGYTAEEPVLPWTLAWTWNGPDAAGGAGGHRYHQPTPYVPWEARTCTGGAHVYVPGNANGLYALKKS